MNEIEYKAFFLATSLLLVAVIGGCVRGEVVRSATYPPSFQYLTEDEIRGTMGGLAAQIVALDALFEDQGPRLRDQDRVIRTLEEMQTLVRQLTRGQQTNHPEIARAVPLLQRKIDRALFGARIDPPNYYFAGTVSGVCSYCHGARHRAGSDEMSQSYGTTTALPPNGHGGGGR